MSLPRHSEFVSQLIGKIQGEIPTLNHENAKLVVAVSGGADSVALLNLLAHLPCFGKASHRLIVGHCNHQTRSDSDKDERFVRDLAEKLKLRLIVQVRPEIEKRNADATEQSEEDLRNFRYDSLIRIAHQEGARYIVTGHTKDDQVETILFRILRGTGLTGLKGIPRMRVTQGITILRPLLNTTRKEVVKFLNEIGQNYVSDESNLQDSYTRNFLRLKVLPLIESRFSEQVRDSLIRLSEQAGDWEAWMDSCIPEIEWLTSDGNCPQIGITNLKDQPVVIQIQSLKKVWKHLRFPEQAMTQQKWRAVAELIQSANDGVVQLPGHVTATKSEKALTFERTKTVRSQKAASK